MNIKVGELISQIRNQTKSLNQDVVYITNRVIYSLFKKNLAVFLQREDGKMKLTRMPFLFQPVIINLREVDKIEADCVGVKTDITFMRSIDRLPNIFKGYYGPIIRLISSADGSIKVYDTTPEGFVKKANLSDAKYNKTKYYFLLDGYLYLPNVDWDKVKVEAMFEKELDDCGVVDPCKEPYQMELPVPEYILTDVQKLVLTDLGVEFQTPGDNTQDKQPPTSNPAK